MSHCLGVAGNMSRNAGIAQDASFKRFLGLRRMRIVRCKATRGMSELNKVMASLSPFFGPARKGKLGVVSEHLSWPVPFPSRGFAMSAASTFLLQRCVVGHIHGDT